MVVSSDAKSLSYVIDQLICAQNRIDPLNTYLSTTASIELIASLASALKRSVATENTALEETHIDNLLRKAESVTGK